MKKFKAILSIALAIAMLCTSFVFAISAQAADTDANKVAADAKLQDNIANGVILHALCWGYSEIEKNIPAIAAAGYSAVQTSPVQQPKDMNTSTNVSGQWWKLYQPVSLSIAKNSWVGTAAELKSLCETAHKYGVKIICDIVSNHLGASEDGYKKLAEEVKTYEPTLWNGNGNVSGNPYFHDPSGTANDNDARSVTQLVSSGCPDLNTGNTTVQNRVVSLLKECIDCGVDGFRFDAAKHIETPSDSGISPNNYWTNVLGQASSYAQSKGGKSIFYYGEVLNTPGGGRSISGYTNLDGGKYRITDNTTSNAIRNAVTSHNASGAINASYSLSGGATHAVLWAESHDTYLNTEAGNTTNVSDSDIVKAWAMVASRKDATALYFARTNGMSMGGMGANTTYKSVAVAEINKFHNNFVGQSEKTGTSGSIAYVARGTSGIVLVNVNGTTASANVSGTGLANGSYKDMITGNSFTVSNGTVSGQIGSTGVAVVTTGSTTPTVAADQESQTFKGDTLTIGLTLSNATSGTYQLDNYTPVTFTGSPKIKIGSDYKAGDKITLTLTATDGTQTTTTTYYYTKAAAASSGVYIILPASVVSSSNWTAPLYCYLYDQDSGKGNTVGGQVYKNASWPGEEMQYDSTLNAYYLEVSDTTCISEKTTKVSGGNVTGSESPVTANFDLAHSQNTHVIVSDSSKSSGGVSQGKQFPGSSSKATLDLKGVSHKITSLTATSGWSTTTEKPGANTNVPATNVTKGNVATTAPPTPEPTTTQPTTPTPTTEPTTAASTPGPTATTPTTEAPTETIPPVIVDGLTYGDVNLDEKIDIADVTAIQKHIASLAPLTGNGLLVADVDANGTVNIKDATKIQMYSLDMSGTDKVGQAYTGSAAPAPSTPSEQVTMPTTEAAPTEAPTQATTEAPTPAPTEAPTESVPPVDPEPAPSDYYTVYLKTTLTWISSMGSEPYLYDNATGESYLMTRDYDAYPYVFYAEVPTSVTDGVIYRATGPSSPENGYNQMPVSYSTTNNCYTLNSFPDGGQPDGVMCPYVEESAPDFALTRLYVENDLGWNAVYLYGWGCGLVDSDTVDMIQIPGTNYWYVDLPEPIPNGVETFLLKGSAGKTDWSQQTANITVQEPYNCYKLSGSWTTYNG